MTKRICKVAKHNYNIINCSNTNVRSNKSTQVHWFRFAMSEDNNDFGAAKEGPYGCGVFGGKRLQWLNTVGWLTFFMFTFCTIYGFNINGALLATITTMEKRFEFSSTISGIILSSYDIGFLITCIPLEACARQSSRGGVLGACCLAISLASLLFAMPHFATEQVVPISGNNSEDALCHLSTRDIDTEPTSESNISLWSIAFIAAGIVTGIACVPIWTTAFATVEDETTIAKGARNMAIMNIGAVFGPLIGLAVGAVCLGTLWTDVKNRENIDLEPTDQNWIGAWWLPYFANGLLGLVLCVPVFGFPNQFPGSHIIKRERSEKSIVEEVSYTSFWSDLKLIMTNPVWILACIGSICDSFITATMIGFGIKFLQVVFYISASYAALLGVICTICALLGVALPLIWMHYKEPEASHCFYAAGTAGIILFLFYIPALIWLTCDNQPLVGVFDQSGQLLDPIQIEQSCNEQCNCGSDLFLPLIKAKVM